MSSNPKKSVTSRIIFDYLLSHKTKILLALVMMVISASYWFTRMVIKTCIR